MNKFRRRAYVKSLKKVKKDGKEGDKIIIVKPSYTEVMHGYKISDIFTVDIEFSKSIRTTCGLHLWNYEYRVLV